MGRDSYRATALFLILLVATFVISAFLAMALDPGENEGPSNLLAWGVSIILVSWILHWTVGLLVNSRSTPQGREWHNTYRLSGSLPLQYGGVPYTVLAWFPVSFSVGDLTARWVGWVTLLAVPPLVLVIAILVTKLLDARRS
ncbi:hypothetical protein [Actinomadura sp. SCN-SB]|uniref:hypothetical protein n=1 Tax=Actinomadura sp. SCN-SB TaxID=3373092 RepID=UPI0037512A6D